MRVLRYLDFLTKNLYSLVINILFLKKKNQKCCAENYSALRISIFENTIV